MMSKRRMRRMRKRSEDESRVKTSQGKAFVKDEVRRGGMSERGEGR